MNDFGVKSSQIKNILSNFGASTQKKLCTSENSCRSSWPCAFPGGLRAQKILVGADFATRFDNREYANNDFNQSQTLFSARLTPRVGVEWQEKNRLVFGVDMLQNFGQHNGAREPFLSDVKPLMYYRFSTENVRAAAGIFDRKELMGDYSPALVSDSVAFYHNRLSGFLGRYVSTQREKTYVEMAIDWEGMYSEESREMFRILSAGRYTLYGGFYFGYAFSMFHFAGSKLDENVTDNLIVNPYAGWEFDTFFDFDVRAGLLFARSAPAAWTTTGKNRAADRSTCGSPAGA